MFICRNYTDKDFEILKTWSTYPVWKELLPSNSTFLCEYEGSPIVSMNYYPMHTPDVALMENLMSKPGLDSVIRHNAVNFLFNYIENEAKGKGFKHIVLFSNVEKLKNRYESLGYKKSMENVTTFAKSLI